MTEIDLSKIFERVREELGGMGIDVDTHCCDPASGSPLKVVCMAGGLADSLKEMEKTPRDQVLMVRIDEETTKKLDAWIETGAFRSRSEAAALFIREGLKIHARELDELEDALKGVEDAKDRLREKAREVFDATRVQGEGQEGVTEAGGE
jgi:Arc/MetJ-type ribon-helix-helix transcriptional regulator